MTSMEIFKVFVVSLAGILPLLAIFIIVWRENRTNHRVVPQVVSRLSRLWVVVENPGKDLCVGKIELPKPPPRIATIIST